MKIVTLAACLLALACTSCRPSPGNGGNASQFRSDTSAVQDAEMLYERGRQHYRDGNYDLAIRELTRASQEDSTQAKYGHLLADSYLDDLQSDRALTTMEQLAERFPDSLLTLLKLAEFQHILTLYDDSFATVGRILQKDPTHPEAYFMLGLNYREQGDINRAINSFQTAVEYDPDLVDAWIILGNLFDELDNPIALQYFENAIRINEKDPRALHGLAFYKQNHGEIREALELYKKIVTIDYRYTDAYLNAGILYIELDSAEQAYEEFNKMVAIDRMNPLGYYYRAVAAEQLGNPEQAREDIDQILRIDPTFDEERLKMLPSYTN